MKCGKCGEKLTDAKQPCPRCGHRMTEQEDMDSIIKNILDEDNYQPKFESNGQGKAKDKKELASKSTNKGSDQKSDGPSKTSQQGANKKTNKATPVKNNSKTTKVPSKSNGKKPGIGGTIVEGLRYVLVGVIVLFTISLFFNWISLSGNAVNQGMVRSEEVKPFIQESIREHSVESLESYEGTIVSFSAMDLNKFSQAIGDQYLTINGPSDGDKTSLVSVMQKYYMRSVLLIMVINFISVVLVLVLKSLKGISIVRNLSVLNFAIIGLNYLALKVPYFSMIAVKAKDTLSLTMEHPQIAMTHNGITLNQSFYPYVVTEEQGFIFALLMLVLWLLLGIVLSEVKNRREEIAIEKGEL